MKKTIHFLTIILILSFNSGFSQTEMKDYKVGHPINISLPNYMSKTLGLNDVATLQYKNTVKDVYGFIIEDNKEELALAELNYSSINEFYDNFIESFLKDLPSRKISNPIFQKKNDISFIECDASYYDDEVKVEIYYLVGVVETSLAYYKVLSWSTVANKDKFKEDFRKILYSLND